MKCSLLSNPLELSDAKRQQKSTRVRGGVGLLHAPEQTVLCWTWRTVDQSSDNQSCSRRGGPTMCVTTDGSQHDGTPPSVWASEVTCPSTNLSVPLPITCPCVSSSTEDRRKRHHVPFGEMVTLLIFLLPYYPFVPNSPPTLIIRCFSVTAAHVSPTTCVVLFQFTSASDTLICMFSRPHLILLPAMLLFSLCAVALFLCPGRCLQLVLV